MTTEQTRHDRNAIETPPSHDDFIVRQLALLEGRIAELESELAAHRLSSTEGVSMLEASTLEGPTPVHFEAQRADGSDSSSLGRRQMLKRFGSAAAGAIAVNALVQNRAAAADGQAVIAGQDNSATTQTGLTVGTALAPNTTFAFAANGNGGAVINGVSAVGSNIGLNAVATRLGVNISSSSSHLRMVPSVPATTDGANLLRGEVRVDVNGNLWFQHSDGSGNSVKLAGPAGAGTLHVINPFRVYDSRAVAILGAGTSRVITTQIANTPVPLGAKAIFGTLTVTETTAPSGWLTITAGDVASTAEASVNWFAAGQTLACAVLTKLDTSARVKVFNNSPAASHFVLDVTGYFR
jgi:hypothetical protein